MLIVIKSIKKPKAVVYPIKGDLFILNKLFKLLPKRIYLRPDKGD